MFFRFREDGGDVFEGADEDVWGEFFAFFLEECGEIFPAGDFKDSVCCVVYLYWMGAVCLCVYSAKR